MRTLRLYSIWDFERVKVPGNPMKSPFCFGVFGGQILAITFCASRQPNHVKLFLSGLSNLLKGAFHLLVASPGDPRGVRCNYFSVRILPHDFGFCPLTGISSRGPQGCSDTALRPDSRFWAPNKTWFLGIYLISEGKTTN